MVFAPALELAVGAARKQSVICGLGILDDQPRRVGVAHEVVEIDFGANQAGAIWKLGLTSGDYVELAVADSGSGMPAEVKARADANGDRAVIVLEDAGPEEIAIHASFFPQLEDLGGGEVGATPAQAAALELTHGCLQAWLHLRREIPAQLSQQRQQVSL